MVGPCVLNAINHGHLWKALTTPKDPGANIKMSSPLSAFIARPKSARHPSKREELANGAPKTESSLMSRTGRGEPRKRFSRPALCEDSPIAVVFVFAFQEVRFGVAGGDGQETRRAD